MAEYTVGNAYLNVVPRIAPNATTALTASGSAMGSSFASSYGAAASGGIASALGGAKLALAGLAAAGVAAVGTVLSSSIEAGSKFDTAMSQVAATMGITMDDLRTKTGETDTAFGHFSGTLEEFAIYMGKNTAFSATQAAEALNYMALAGYDTQESMNMLPNVLSLAAAGGFDLARASDMVTDAQTAFGISSDRTTQMVDEMAKAASTGNTSVEQLGDAFLVVGGLAKELNGGMITLKDGSTATVDGVQELEIALTAMANAGVKGSEAGTHMRNMLLKLSSPTAEGVKQMEELGVSVFDAEGNMRSLNDIFGDLNSSFSTLTQEEKLQAISEIFNTRDIASAEALLAAVEQDWDGIGESIINAQGAAAQMAETQLDNLAGDVEAFGGALESIQIEIFHGIEPALRALVGTATEVLGEINGMLSGDNSFVNGLVETWKPAIEALQNAFTAAWPNIQTAGSAILGVFASVVEYISGVLSPVVQLLAPVVGGVINVIAGAIQVIAPIISGVFEMLSAFLVPAVQWLADTFGPLLEAIFGIFSDNLPLFGEMVSKHVGRAVEMAQSFAAQVGEKLQPLLDMFQDFIINHVVPALQDFSAWIAENVIPAIDAMWTWFEANLLPILSDFVNFVLEHVVPALVDIFKWVGDNVVPVLEDLAKFIGDNVIPVISDIASWLADTLAGAFRTVYDFVKYNILPVLDTLTSAIDSVIGWFSDMIDWATEAINAGNEAAAAGGHVSYGGYTYYASGGFVDVPTIVAPGKIAGEAGPEMILPRTGTMMDSFANAIAARIGGGGGVTISGNQFVIREEADIDKLSRALINEWKRKQQVGSWA